jgi:lipopolysaccharide/colanic/teichoic acid biosynthesis glycosyltransferase
MDLVAGTFLLITASPVMLAVAATIWICEGRPIFYPWRVVGQHGKPLRSWKFHTMRPDADQRKQELLPHNEMQGPVFKMRDEPPITRSGRFLRKYSLDELPQFFNVLKGDMSVVGPRPELTYFVQKFRAEIPAYMARHNVKCGITGWAQINGLRGSDTSIPERIKCDLYYMRNWSMALDLKIIFLTVLNGLMNRHAY